MPVPACGEREGTANAAFMPARAAAAAAAPAPIAAPIPGKALLRSAMCCAAVMPGRPGTAKSHSLRFTFLNATICERRRWSCSGAKPEMTRKLCFVAAARCSAPPPA